MSGDMPPLPHMPSWPYSDNSTLILYATHFNMRNHKHVNKGIFSDGDNLMV